MADVETNLRVLRPSRKKPMAGDLFAMQLPDEQFLFGRVISTEATIGPMQGVILVYIYWPRFDSKEPPDRSMLSFKRLLVSPILTNRLPWTRGYFETVAHWPLQAEDMLPQHCFLDTGRGRYLDEKNNILPGPIEPVGDWGLESFRTIDDQISDALGLARVPD